MEKNVKAFKFGSQQDILLIPTIPKILNFNPKNEINRKLL